MSAHASPLNCGYALREDRVVHISEVPRGLACECVCLSCGQPQVARKGLDRRHHFAHHIESGCLGSVETLLHRLAKQLLSAANAIWLLAYVYRGRLKPDRGRPVAIERTLFARGRLPIHEIWVEHRRGAIVPDIILPYKDRELFLEIAVTHRVDRAKLRHVRRLNSPLLELRLTPEDIQLGPAELARKLTEDARIKRWLFHPNQRSTEREWLTLPREAARRSRERRSAG